jgi:hypothetical protein
MAFQRNKMQIKYPDLILVILLGPSRQILQYYHKPGNCFLSHPCLFQFTYSLALWSSQNLCFHYDRSQFFSIICLFLPSSNDKSLSPSSSYHSLALPTFQVTFKNLLSHPCPIHCNHVPLPLQTSPLQQLHAVSSASSSSNLLLNRWSIQLPQ